MLTFTVHEPPRAQSDRLDRADNLIFVKDGFSWPTAIFPPLGLGMARLWREVIVYFGAVGVVAYVLTQAGVPSLWVSILMTALNVYLAFEVSSLQRWSLDRRGWTMLGAVTGKNLAECERRFFESWLPEQPVIQAERGLTSTAAEPPQGRWPFASRA